MKKLLFFTFLLLFTVNVGAESLHIDGHEYIDTGVATFNGMSEPAVSGLDTARLYYDLSQSTLHLSENGNSYYELLDENDDLDKLGNVAALTEASGDILYYNGSNWTVLNIGSAGQVLEVNAGGTGVEWDSDDSGSLVIYDLADDGNNESTNLSELAITNDTGSVWSEPSADKALFDGTNLLYESELDSESELETQLADVTDVYTDNDFTDNSSNWDTAFGWGDHSGAGYLTTESDTLDSVFDRGNDITQSSFDQWLWQCSAATGTEDTYLILIDDDRTGATAGEASEATLAIDAEGGYALYVMDGYSYFADYVYLGNYTYLTGNTTLYDDTNLNVGSGADLVMMWDTNSNADDLISWKTSPSASDTDCWVWTHDSVNGMTATDNFVNPTLLWGNDGGADVADNAGCLMGWRTQNDVTTTHYFDFYSLVFATDSGLDATTTEVGPTFRFGDNPAAADSAIGSGDVVFNDDVEIDGTLWCDGNAEVAANLEVGAVSFDSSAIMKLYGDSNGPSDSLLVLELGEAGPIPEHYSSVLFLTENLNPSNMSTHNDYVSPTLVIANSAGADANDYAGVIIGERTQSNVAIAHTFEFLAITDAVDDAVDATTTEVAADFGFGTTSDTDMLFVDTGNGRVGIQTNAPGYSLGLGTGQSFGIGTTQWNSSDSIDGEQIAADTIDDDSIDFGSGADQVDIADIPGGTAGANNFDFAAADVELPQASPAAPDADGEIEVDMTDGSLVIQNSSSHAELGASTDVVYGKIIKSWGKTYAFPDSLQSEIDNWPFMAVESSEFPHGIVITDIYLKTSAASTYAVNVENWDDPTTINGVNGTIDAITTSANTEAHEDTITYATIAAGQIIMLDLPTTDIGWFYIQIDWYEPTS